MGRIFSGSLSARGYRLLNPRIGPHLRRFHHHSHAGPDHLSRHGGKASPAATWYSASVPTPTGAPHPGQLRLGHEGHLRRRRQGSPRNRSRIQSRTPAPSAPARGLLQVAEKRRRKRAARPPKPPQSGGRLKPVFRDGKLLPETNLAEIPPTPACLLEPGTGGSR